MSPVTSKQPTPLNIRGKPETAATAAQVVDKRKHDGKTPVKGQQIKTSRQTRTRATTNLGSERSPPRRGGRPSGIELVTNPNPLFFQRPDWTNRETPDRYMARVNEPRLVEAIILLCTSIDIERRTFIFGILWLPP